MYFDFHKTKKYYGTLHLSKICGNLRSKKPWAHVTKKQYKHDLLSFTMKQLKDYKYNYHKLNLDNVANSAKIKIQQKQVFYNKIQPELCAVCSAADPEDPYVF